MKKSSVDWMAVAAICMAMLVWASSFVALKAAIGPLGPFTVTFLRMCIASLCFVYFLKDFAKLKFTKKDIKYIALLTFLEPCLYFIFESKALQYTSAGQAGMITSMMPLITAFGAGVFLKEFISKKLIIGSSIAVIGAILLSVSASSMDNATNPLLGNFLEFLAMICGSGYAISIRYLSARYSAIFLTAIQSFIGAIFFFPFALWEYNTIVQSFQLETLLWVIYLGIVVTLGGYGLFNYALGRIEASKASVYVNLIPVFTVFLAFFILGEKLSFVEIVASIVILIGVFISQMPTEKIKAIKAIMSVFK